MCIRDSLLADRAKQLTGGESPAVLDTVSAAYAENGNFAQAIETEQTALNLATQQGKSSLATKLQALSLIHI